MSLSRKGRRRKNKRSANLSQPGESLSSYVHIQNKLAPPPPCLPSKAKPLRKIYFPFKREEDAKAQTTANKRNIAVKVGHQLGDDFLHFKQSKRVSIFHKEPSISEVEVVSASWLKFLLFDECVPTMRVWYDEETYEIVGRTSKNLKDFVTNHKKPFKDEDTIITLNVDEEVEQEISIQRNSLLQAADSLLKEVKSRKEKEASYIPGVGFLKGIYNRNISGETGTKLLDFLQLFEQATLDIKFSAEKLEELLGHLRARHSYILEYKNDEEHRPEVELLRGVLRVADYLYRLTKKTTVPLSAIPIVDQLYRKAVKDKLDLISEPDKKLELHLKNKTYSITYKSLNNYRKTSRQIRQLAGCFENQDTDRHNQNQSADGRIVDFDRAKLPFSFPLADTNFWDKLVREPDDTFFVITPYDITHFPAIKDAKFHYWPPNATNVSQTILPKLSWVMPANFFGPQDNEAYSNLEYQPAAIFNKYVQFLKYALCDGKMYESIARLHMRPYVTYIDKKDAKIKNLLADMVADETQRIEKMREVLVTVPQFQDILDQNGEYLFEVIKQEFIAKREKYENVLKTMEAKKYNKFGQLIDTGPLKRLINSINIGEIEQRFKEIFKDAARNCNSSEEPKKNLQPSPVAQTLRKSL